MQFLSYRKRSFIPFEVFNQIGNLFLKKQIKEGKCTIKSHLRYKFYECDKDIVVQNITFVFGDWEFTLQEKDLYKENKENNTKELILYYRDNFDVFVLGRSILKGFEMVYDYANKQIGFYHERVRYKGKQKVSPPKIYQFLEDEEEYQPYKIKDGYNILPETKPEEVRIKNADNVPEGMMYQITDVIKNILSILIILLIVIILIAGCIYSKKYSKKEKVKKANKYLQEEMVEKESSEK